MASSKSPDASEIRRRGRRRLIGAVALVMLLVVFVPMILDSEPRPARDGPSLAIPSREAAPPLPAPPPATPAPIVEPPKAAPATVPAPSASAEKKSAAAPVAAAPKLEGFAVQVGAFRDEETLRQAREKLAATGVVHYTERLETQGGTLTRLRAGPFPTREAAEAALARLKRSSLDGTVVAL